MSFEIENGILKEYIPESGETEVVIPDGVTRIGKLAFCGCDRLTSITIPDSVTSIGDLAFSGCSNLTSIAIPGSVTSIGSSAFQGCDKLTNISSASRVKGIGSEIIGNFKIENGVLKEYLNDRETEVVIPEGVKIIGDLVFCGSRLKSVTIPKGVKIIEDLAFVNCDELRSIVIPDGVTSIGDRAFEGCSRLASVTIPDSVKQTETTTFSGCDRLTSLVANPDILLKSGLKVTAVLTFLRSPEDFSAEQTKACKKYLFAQKKKLLPEIFRNDLAYAMQLFAEAKKITKSNVRSDFLDHSIRAGASQCNAFLMDWENRHFSPEDKEKLLENEFEKDPFNAADMKKLWSYKSLEDGTLCLTKYKGSETHVTIPSRIGECTVTALGEKLIFARRCGSPSARKENFKKIASITIPDTITSIGEGAFAGCVGLPGITIPGSVKRIEKEAFRDCRKLTSVIISDGVANIGTSVFRGCTALGSITLPDSIKAIGGWTFYECDSLNSITIPRRVKRIGHSTFALCSSLTSIVIPDGVNSIGDEAFFGCQSLTSITIPDSVTSIGEDAFENCDNITIYASKDSFAYEYAKKVIIPFEFI